MTDQSPLLDDAGGESTWTLPPAGIGDLPAWEARMTAELTQPRYWDTTVRILGDFPTDAYLVAWLDIARATPDTTFCTHTDQVDRFARLAEADAPDNFVWTHPGETPTDDDRRRAARGPRVEG